MRRWLLILLIAFLPVQFASAAAAVYCAHESDSSPKHLGHHADGVATAQKVVADDQDGGATKPPLDHAGCAYAHLGCAVHPLAAAHLNAQPTSTAKPLDSPTRFRSCVATVLDRPQWLSLA